MTLTSSPAETTVAVGIGQCAITSDPRVTLVTYGLGSCVGIAAWDPMARIAGLLHVLLPEPPSLGGVVSDSGAPPTRFALTGVPHLLGKLQAAGAQPSRLRVWAIGGARMLGALSTSTSLVGNIGERNAQVVCDQLKEHGIRLVAHDFGGAQGRTLGLRVESGECWMRVAGGPAIVLGTR